MALQLSVSAYTETMQKPHLILADWDTEAGAWVAASGDVPGLVTESDTLEGLDAKLQTMVPELLQANGVVVAGDGAVTWELVARRFGVASAALN